MLALSGAVHLLTFLLGAVWLVLRTPPVLLSPVAVVDLVSGSQFNPPGPEAAGRSQGPPAAATRPAPVPKQGKAAEKMAPPAATLSPPTAAREVSPQEARAFSDMIGRLRKEKEARAAVESIQRQQAARIAVRNIGKRVARRVDLSPLRPPGAGPGPSQRSAALGGSSGNARVSPELMAYARALDEKIRASWTVPEPALKEAGKLIVQVRITIEKDGRVSSVRMEKDSGSPYFDDSVLRAIRKASPLPVPPEQLRGGEDHYEVGFRFHGGGSES